MTNSAQWGRVGENCSSFEEEQAYPYIRWTERGDFEQFKNMSKNEKSKTYRFLSLYNKTYKKKIIQPFL